MKRMKKILSVLLSVVMVMAMGITAFAEGDSASAATSTSNYSVTINNATGTYEIYQVFAGDLSVDSDTGVKTLSNVTWGKDVNKFLYTTKDATGTEQEETGNDAAKIAEYLATKNNDSVVAKDFAKKAIDSVKTDSNSGIAIANTNGKATFTGLSAGYYVVANTSVGTSESYTEYILQVVGDVTVENKADVPELEKKVKDKNDTTGTTTEWQDSADYDIGDVIPFQLKGTIADNYDAYTSYYYAFHDVEESGLTFKEISEVYVMNNNQKTVVPATEYILKTDSDVSETAAGKCSFEIVFSDLKNLKGTDGNAITINKDSEIYVEYTSTLNNKAVLGNQGNVNKAKLEFSNNPNGIGKGETPWDNVIVFTYKVVINKVDAKSQPLKGAEFTLSKQVAKTIKDDGSVKDYELKTVQVAKNSEGTEFTFSGLDDGTYILTETVTPKGFNTIEPITFTVTAEHNITWEGTNRTDVLTKLSGDKVSGEITFAPNVKAGSLTATVVNKEGTVLPSTGGIGTTIFYVVGAILMIGAGVVLVSRRRANK